MKKIGSGKQCRFRLDQAPRAAHAMGWTVRWAATSRLVRRR
jgi:hypothetical protein